MAAAGGAFAQSSVTIYGKLDQGLTRAIGADKFSLAEASGSRVGFRGTEDLGGGLKANFQIENRFSPDTGAANANFWNGTSIVGLQGNFGRLDIGRTYTAAFYTALGGDVFGWDGVANNGASTRANTTPTTSPAIRFANGVFYTSPNFSGLTVRFSHAQKEGTDVKNGRSFQLAYANGPLSGSLASEVTTANNKYAGIGAAYDFGAARVSALFSAHETASGVQSDGMTLGLTVPMGALTLKASYATLESNNVKSVQQLGLGMRYALSKRTDIYSSYANNSKSTAAKKNGFEIGVQHNF